MRPKLPASASCLLSSVFCLLFCLLSSVIGRLSKPRAYVLITLIMLGWRYAAMRFYQTSLITLHPLDHLRLAPFNQRLYQTRSLAQVVSWYYGTTCERVTRYLETLPRPALPRCSVTRLPGSSCLFTPVTRQPYNQHAERACAQLPPSAPWLSAAPPRLLSPVFCLLSPVSSLFLASPPPKPLHWPNLEV